MKLTPLDIKKQEFKRNFRGYDHIEVDAFLETVADEYEALIRDRNRMSDEVLKLKTQLKDYQEVERTFKESLMKAQQTLDDSRDNARHESELIIREAELKADKILESTKIQLAEMKNELMLIKSQKDSFAKRLKHLLESQLELIGVLEIDDIGLGRFDERETSEPISSNFHEKKKDSHVEFTPVEDEDVDARDMIRMSSGDDFKFNLTNQKEKYASAATHEAKLTTSTPTEEDSGRDNRRRVRLSDKFIIN
ncbi:DivIVA domain-containing protein [candidate division KSB1 bacterium]|nr:DivIVA domain-containing protein [candidate division KSB1 bacterium]